MELIFMFAYFLFIALVVEISADLFTLTGLNKEVARYQAISMLTNTGFTTDEAKLIIDHPIRRKLSSFLILFGAFSLAVVISILSTFLSNDIQLLHIGIGLMIITVFFLFLKMKPVKKYLQKKLHANLKEAYALDELSVKDILYLKDDDYLVDVPIYKDSPYVDVTCEDLFPKDEDLFLLLIKRGTEILRHDLDQESVMAGDLLYVYGNKYMINKKFQSELQTAAKKKSEESRNP